MVGSSITTSAVFDLKSMCLGILIGPVLGPVIDCICLLRQLRSLQLRAWVSGAHQVREVKALRAEIESLRNLVQSLRLTIGDLRVRVETLESTLSLIHPIRPVQLEVVCLVGIVLFQVEVLLVQSNRLQ